MNRQWCHRALSDLSSSEACATWSGTKSRDGARGLRQDCEEGQATIHRSSARGNTHPKRRKQRGWLCGWRPARDSEGASFGLGIANTGAYVLLEPVETVLDFGLGTGLDAYFAAPKVGPTGHVAG